MEVLCALLFVVSAVSSLGSGPYLPSGWRPSGPAFLLPSEVQAFAPVGTTSEPKIPEDLVILSGRMAEVPEASVKQTETTTIDVMTPNFAQESSSQTITSEDVTTESTFPSKEQAQDLFVQETEASGSDYLREYGPPAVLDIHQSVTVQGLPDIVTARSFKTDEARISQDEAVLTNDEVTEDANVSNNPENENEKVCVQTEATTELKSSEEEISADAIKLTSSLNDIDTEEVTDAELAEASTAKSDDTIAEEKSSTEGTVIVRGNINAFVKTINPESEVPTKGKSLEYLPPVSNEESNQANEVQLADAEPSEEPPTVSEIKEDSDVVPKPEIKEDEGNVEESSGVGQVPDVLNVQERVGFRMYGPPNSETEVRKSAAERIENNETRRRRFSSRFASFNKH